MPPARVLFAFCSLAAMTAAAEAQPLGRPGQFKIATFPVLSGLLPYVGDENFQKELGLSAEQAKKLVAFRQKIWDETYTTSPQERNLGEQNKAIEAEVKSVLDAKQLKRAKELATRIAWTNARFGPGFGPVGGPEPDARTVSAYTLAQYPEIAAALKLDDAQMRLVENAGGPGGFGRTDDIYLSPDQTALAKAMRGDAPKAAFVEQYDPRTGGFGGGFIGGGGGGGRGGPFGTVPPPLRYLLSPDVQKDLGLDDKQVQAFADLQAKFPAARRFDPTKSPAEEKKAADALREEVAAAVAKQLTADQKKRFEEIQRQQRQGSEFAEGSELAKILGVTAEQRKARVAALEVHVAAVVKAVGSGEPAEKVKAAVEAAGKTRDAALEKILTADQQAKKADWLGKPFTGRIPPNIGGPSPLVAIRRLTFGRYYNQLNLASQYPAVRAELNLSDDQMTKLREAAAEVNQKFPLQDVLSAAQDPNAEKAEKMMAERSAAVEKALGEILKKEQMARLRELMIQQAEGPRMGGFVGDPLTAAAVPGVAEALKLTAEQKKQLQDNTAPPARVLTDDQKAAIKKMMGKPVNVAEVFARPFGPRLPAAPAIVSLAQNTAYWDVVKVESGQAAKLAAAFNRFNLAMADPERTPEQRTAAGEAGTKEVEGALKAEQRKRLEQLALQARAANSLVTALLGTPTTPSAVKKELAITDEQEKAIRAAPAELLELAEFLDRVEFAGPEGEPRKDVTEMRMKLRDKLDAKVEAVLTADQRAKWKTMVGDPHSGFTKQPLFGNRGPGGFGGGGFGGPFGP